MSDLSGSEFLRYSRQIMLPEVGEQGQLKLKNSTVLIVGLGGLGCPVAMYLARAGVGSLILCDHDVVDTTNLQRQILYDASHSNVLKVEAAKQVLESINPHINIVAIDRKFKDVNQTLTVDYSIDAIADCTDNHSARMAINDYCKANETYWVSGAAMGWGGRIVEFQCQLQQMPCYLSLHNEDYDDSNQNCATMGVLGSVLGMIGSMQATAILKQLLGISNSHHGLVNQYDAKAGEWFSYHLS